MTQLPDEAVVIYPAPAIRTCGENEIPAPDHRRLAALPYRETVMLMTALTGSPDRLLFHRNGSCLMPIQPDGRHAPFRTLRAVMDSAPEINAWLAETANHRGVPPVTPAWLGAVPAAAERLLKMIRQRVAHTDTLNIVLGGTRANQARMCSPCKVCSLP